MPAEDNKASYYSDDPGKFSRLHASSRIINKPIHAWLEGLLKAHLLSYRGSHSSMARKAN